MNEESNPNWEADVSALVKRYEDMIQQNESWFFDVEQFEAIIEFYLETNKANKALNVLSYAENIFPGNLSLAYRKAQVFAGIGKLAKAVKCLLGILQVEKNNEDAQLLLANIYSQQREHKKAIAYYSSVLANTTDDSLADEVCIDLALEYENINNWNAAIDVLKKALERNKENETAIYELAYCFEMANKNEECIRFYKQFIDDNPFSFTAWYNLGNSYQKAGFLDECLEAYDFCLAVEPDFSPCSFNKANALVKLERFPEAIAAYNDSMEFEGPQSVTYPYIGECYEKLNELDLAVNYYKKALQEDQANAEAHIGLGVVYDMLERPLDSLRHFRTVLELEVDDSEVLILIVTALRRASYFEEAIEIAEAVIADDENNPEAWMELCEVYLEMGAKEDLIFSTLDDAYRLTLYDGDIAARKAAFLHLFKKREEAYALIEVCFQRHPESIASLLEYYPEILNDDRFVVLHASYKS